MGLRQSCRPKHQVLILKCYPKYQKSTTDVKPNSSELSYLLYYASTRRSKLQKVGAYLEKRTISDVYRSRLGNIQVTLQILAALIEKCPRDLPLYSSYVLNILSQIIDSKDINFIEESVPTFTALCTHLDHAIFAADPLQAMQYEDNIRAYARFASKTPSINGLGRSGLPEVLRLREAGVRAIQALVSPETFPATQTHLSIVIPVVLEQLVSDDPHYLSRLEARESMKEQYEKEQLHRRRPSLAGSKSFEVPRTPLRTTDTSEADPIDAAGTTEDVDEKATEELGVIAIQTLRKMFSTDNRGLVRSATALTITYVLDIATKSSTTTRPTTILKRNASPWTTALFDRICAWTPVQDRFIILVTMVESLTNLPIPPHGTTSGSAASEKDHTPHHALTPAITHLLRSSYNFIGLSVLDILLGILDTIRSASSSLFLAQLRDCVGALAGHIYYGDQIPDMISAIALRLQGDMQRACVQEVLEASRTDLKSLRLSTNVRLELGLETPDANSGSNNNSKGSASASGSGSRARRAAAAQATEREMAFHVNHRAQLQTLNNGGVPSSESSQRAVLGVEDLKRALAGGAVPSPSSRAVSMSRVVSSAVSGSVHDTATDSLVSVGGSGGGFSGSEVSLQATGDGAGAEREQERLVNGIMSNGGGKGVSNATMATWSGNSHSNGSVTKRNSSGSLTVGEAAPLHHTSSTPLINSDIPPVPALPKEILRA